MVTLIKAKMRQPKNIKLSFEKEYFQETSRACLHVAKLSEMLEENNSPTGADFYDEIPDLEKIIKELNRIKNAVSVVVDNRQKA
jgi:hypothetical protein